MCTHETRAKYRVGARDVHAQDALRRGVLSVISRHSPLDDWKYSLGGVSPRDPSPGASAASVHQDRGDVQCLHTECTLDATGPRSPGPILRRPRGWTSHLGDHLATLQTTSGRVSRACCVHNVCTRHVVTGGVRRHLSGLSAGADWLGSWRGLQAIGLR